VQKIFLLFCLFFSFVWFVSADQILVENVFSDINFDYEYRDELQALYDRGMILPNESGKFSPNAYLNRDEFVGISMEVICERCIQPHTEQSYIEKYFNEDVYFDIDNTNPYFYCVAEADAQNYVRWYNIGESCENGVSKFWEPPFCPLNRINLEEAVAVLLRNSGIFTITDNQSVVADIYAGNITKILWNDVKPAYINGNPYTFYWYIRKALDYEIIEYDTNWESKIFRLLELDTSWNVNPQKSITKEEFLKMSYIALKSNSCSEISDNGLALRMNVLEKSCEGWDTADCPLSDLDDPDDTYDFEPVVEWFCEAWIEDPTWYIWRFHNLTTGEQHMKFWSYVDNYLLDSPWEWRVYLRVIDKCWNSSEIYSTIFVWEEEDPEWDQFIDVDIDVYDDDCESPWTSCEEIEFEDEEDDGDDIFDFDGDVSTSCNIWSIDYHWTFTHVESGQKYEYYQEYIDDVLLGLTGEWYILLEVVDWCGQTWSENLRYIVVDEEDPEWDQFIDVDIDVYDDDCESPWTSCEEIEFEDEEDDGDDIFDFDWDVITSCSIWSIDYYWTFAHEITWATYNFNIEFVENFDFLHTWVWSIVLEVKDWCGQTWVQSMTYIVDEQWDYTLNVTIIADPIYWYEDLEVDFNAISSGGEGPFIYDWDFWDGQQGLSRDIEHIYLDDGIYDVLLTVIDSNGVEWTATVVIVVLERDECLEDTDGDGIVDCDDSCPLIVWDILNGGCPIFEINCSVTCWCEPGYVCSNSDPLTCGAWICVPVFEPETSCLYTPEVWWIYGNAVCATCPCDTYLDFLADVRKCDLVFPAITSPDGTNIYSQWDIWQVQ
jgi:PKD repeat protein